MRLRIETDRRDPSKPRFGLDARVYLDDGTELLETRDIIVRIPVDGIVTATVEVIPRSVTLTAEGTIVTEINGKRYQLVEL